MVCGYVCYGMYLADCGKTSALNEAGQGLDRAEFSTATFFYKRERVCKVHIHSTNSLKTNFLKPIVANRNLRYNICVVDYFL